MIIAVVLIIIAVCLSQFILFYRKKTIKKFYNRRIIYDESEFYMLLSEYAPNDDNIHKGLTTEKQHAMIVEEVVIKVGLFDKKLKKIKSKKTHVEYYIPGS